MCKQYFVMRVSTKRVKDKVNKEEEIESQFQQDFKRQEYVFKSAGYNITPENTFADRITGSSKMEARPRFNELLSILEEGDYVYFVDLSRFSRSLANGTEMIETLLFEKKVNIVFVEDNRTLYANQRFNASEWFAIMVNLLVAEFMRRNSGQMTSQKLQALKAEGVKLGAPCTIPEETVAEVLRLRGQGLSYQDIERQTGVSRGSISRFCNRGKK